ncbi:MAG: hypothetical protein AB7K24_33345, partial [Gemmataceae bacterium]
SRSRTTSALKLAENLRRIRRGMADSLGASTHIVLVSPKGRTAMGWETIRANRYDITDYVIHLTRFVVERDDGTRDVKSGFFRLKVRRRAAQSGPAQLRWATRDLRLDNGRFG